ncbi:GNAT family N-acetyltransferase [Streptomyces sp. NPDC003656]|uniref:GNAT family N-acetyltransferase n=1 Tax=Streptomyces sp. DSM 110735 TaxID=2775031 RepID=UPI0018F29F65|nr:GNAT family N-acetyltransferase [Streptomyces sp. DSM 110735]MBJ7905245.1 GNAT family N-acetyltransferase [Streptomyces sp. DSM 110735]
MPILVPPVLPAGALARLPQPVIPAADGLLLRPWRKEDAPGVHAAFQDPAQRQWHGRFSESVDEVEGWIERWLDDWTEESRASWAVAEADTGEVVGRVALREIHLEDGCAEVAYWTVARSRGRGVAVTATGALTRWAFEDIGFHRLELTHSTANEASCRVAAKAGYDLEGTRRSYVLHQDGWHDMHLHARVNER